MSVIYYLKYRNLIAVENCSLLIELAERKVRQTNTFRLAMAHLRAQWLSLILVEIAYMFVSLGAPVKQAWKLPYIVISELGFMYVPSIKVYSVIFINLSGHKK